MSLPSNNLIASTSRAAIRSTRIPSIRTYAAGQNPHLAVPSDSRTDTLRQTLYPQDAYSPSSSSPTGSYHPNHLERLKAVIPSSEAYETIERAYRLLQREKRLNRQKNLEAKYKSMEIACNELQRMTLSVEEGGDGYSKGLYDRAMGKSSGMPVEETTKGGKKTSGESRFLEARIEGLVPREAWVPTETRGKGWNYDWKRPKA